jgi:hypothetical protein
MRKGDERDPTGRRTTERWTMSRPRRWQSTPWTIKRASPATPTRPTTSTPPAICGRLRTSNQKVLARRKIRPATNHRRTSAVSASSDRTSEDDGLAGTSPPADPDRPDSVSTSPNSLIPAMGPEDPDDQRLAPRGRTTPAGRDPDPDPGENPNEQLRETKRIRPAWAGQSRVVTDARTRAAQVRQIQRRTRSRLVCSTCPSCTTSSIPLRAQCQPSSQRSQKSPSPRLADSPGAGVTSWRVPTAGVPSRWRGSWRAAARPASG